MQKSKQVFSTGQQAKFQELQIEIAALEKQVEKALKEQSLLVIDNTSDNSAIPLIYVNEQVAKSGIRLAHETAY